MGKFKFSCQVVQPGHFLIFVVLSVICMDLSLGFMLCCRTTNPMLIFPRPLPFRGTCRRYFSESIFIIVTDHDDEDDENGMGVLGELIEDDDEDDAPIDDDPYLKMAPSEFTANVNATSNTATDLVLSSEISTTVDWGGALGKLRQRFDDIEQGKSGNPSQALFRLMSAQPPNQAIGSFVNSASPQVVQAMSGAVNSLLGGLSSPTSGVETIVKATGSKIGSLCFQLQMTGYV
jgi:Protein of unknown function (DUF760)